MRFLNFYQVIQEGTGRNYVAPKDPRQGMADFYILAYLSTIDMRDKVTTAKNIRNRDFQPQVEYMNTTLLDSLKPTLLEDLLYSLSAELRHIGHMTDEFNDYTKNFSNRKELHKIAGEILEEPDASFVADVMYFDHQGSRQFYNRNRTDVDPRDEDLSGHDERFDTFKDENGYDTNETEETNPSWDRTMAYKAVMKSMKEN